MSRRESLRRSVALPGATVYNIVEWARESGGRDLAMSIELHYDGKVT